MKKVTKEHKHSAQTCPMTTAMKQIGGKWKLLLVYYLATQTKRFSQLKRDLPTITTKMLTQQLRELESDGIVSRKVSRVVPPKVEYSLTAKGKKLLPIIEALNKWVK